MAGRPDLTEYQYRKARARVLAESDTCILCGHPGADAVDHVIPVSKGGAKTDPDNLAPIHGVNKCPTCLRNCNGEKSNKPLSQITRLTTSQDWYAGG